MGDIEKAVTATLATSATADVPMRDPLVALAIRLAQILDGDAGSSAPATAAQLRHVLDKLTPVDTSGDDQFRAFLSDLHEKN